MCMRSVFVGVLGWIVFGAIAFAQEWRIKPPVIEGEHARAILDVYSSVRVQLFEPITKQFVAHSGHGVVVGDSLGAIWKGLPFPTIWTVSDVPKISASMGKIFAFWYDLSRVGEDRLARYDSENKQWKLVAPVEFEQLNPIGIVDSMLIVEMNKSNTIYISTDLGDTWMAQAFKRPIGGTRKFANPSPSIVSLRSGMVGNQDIWYELQSGSPMLVERRLPTYTNTYRYVDSNAVIGSRYIAGLFDSTTQIIISRDAGITWLHLDSIQFENSTLVLGGSGDRSKFAVERIETNKFNHTTLWFIGAHIATTTDNGLTWWDRSVGLPIAKSSTFNSYHGSHIIAHMDGSFSFPILSRLGYLPSDVTKPAELRSPFLNIRTLAFHNGVFIAGSLYGLLRSADSGATWFQSGVAQEIVNTSKNFTVAQHSVVIDQISPIDSANIYGACTFTSDIVRWSQQFNTWQVTQAMYLPGLYGSPTPFSSSEPKFNNTELCARQQGVVKFTPEATLYNESYSIRRYRNNSDSTSLVIPGTTDLVWSPITSYNMLDSATHFATRDSLYISHDAGSTWIAGGKGLPQNADKDLVSCSGIVRLNDGNLLASFKGSYTLSDTGDIAFYAGGFFISSDEGLTWSRRDEGLDTNLCVWFTHLVPGTDTVIAAVGKIIRGLLNVPEPNYNYSMTDGRIIRSTNGGQNWQDVYLETRTRPGFTGLREILSHPDGRILAATIESGVIESFDAGITWRTLGDNSLQDVFINDIAIDTMGLVYASTNLGVYYFVPPATSVDEPIESFRITTLYAYPTPTVGQLRIRVNNLGLSGAWSSLKLYNLYGGVEADLTNALRQTVQTQPSAQRYEFDYYTTALHNGVFLLVLETEKETLTMKVAVSK